MPLHPLLIGPVVHALVTIYDETDDFSYIIVKDPCHIHDFHATVLHLPGFKHEKFTFKHQGLDQKLTGVEKSRGINNHRCQRFFDHEESHLRIGRA